VRVGVTDAPILGLAGPALPEAPDKGRKIREMPGRDLRSSGQMFEAIHLDGPRRVIRQDVSDPGLLGTGEHGGGIVAEERGLDQSPMPA